MLFFHNPGLIDLEAVRTRGASVKLPGSFGQFGTGLSYSLAAILRDGGAVTMYRGSDRHEFHTEERMIRGERFEVVCMDGEALGFTTQLGKHWEPWMILRELGCNARDEGGDFDSYEQGRKLADFTTADGTVLVVGWDKLDEAWRERGQLFLEGEPLFENDRLRILPGPSPYLFYRGVRVFKLEKPAIYTYDLIERQALTEDRTLYGDWSAKIAIRDTLLEWQDREALAPVISAGSARYEDSLAFDENFAAKPSRAFLDTVIEARTRGAPGLNETAKRVLLAHMRKAAGDEESYGGSYRRARSDAFAYAIDALNELGVEFNEDQPFITVEELPGEALSMVEEGRVYVLRELLRRPAPEIAAELLKRWADLNALHTPEAAVEALGALLLAQHEGMKRAMKLLAEDEAQPEAEAA